MLTLKGMQAFSFIWFGQLISQVGTIMVGLALSIWAWQETTQATSLALISFFLLAPSIFLSPVAGVFVDRWNRKLTLILSDLGAGLASIIVLILLTTNTLEIWHLYALSFWKGIFHSFQFPAFSVVISLLVNEKDYARASGMLSLVQSGANVVAPLLSGILLSSVGLKGVLVIDIASFVMAIFLLLLVAIPKPESPKTDSSALHSFWQELGFGFSYIFNKRKLIFLLILNSCIALVGAVGMVLIAPMILARTGNDEILLGGILSSMGAGGVVGGLLLSVWGGPDRKIVGVLGGLFLMSSTGYVLLGVGQTAYVWLVGAFNVTLFLPFLLGSNQAIWQVEVPVAVQGKVFSARQFISQAITPLVFITAAPLADRFFETAMRRNSPWRDFWMPIVGSGTGSGIAVIFVLTGLMGISISLLTYFVYRSKSWQVDFQ